MKTVKRLNEDDLHKTLADHFKVNEDHVYFNLDDWRYEDWICEVEVE